MMSKQDSKELRAFQRFCKLVGIEVAQIEECDSPHPDILASVDGEMVAYELTEAVEPEYARKLSDMLKTPPLVREQYDAIPQELRNQIKAMHRGKVIDICFHSNVSLRERRKSLIDIFGYIAEVPKSFGNDGLERIERPLEPLDHIAMSNVGWDGIHWEAGAPGSWIDPESALTERLLDKMKNKKYESTDPIELIVYLDRQVSPPENTGWEDRLATLASEQLGSSSFRVVWLMNCWSKSVRQLT